MKPILRLALLLILLLAGMVVLAFYWTFYKPLPDYSATLKLSGLEAPVEIHWDPFGVPHIYADHEEDLYYALGYIHAQERLWQMTFSQLAAEGRFAEYIGKELLDFDKYQRTLGFWETAQRIEEEAPDSLRHILDNYSSGVNDFIEENRGLLPIEFSLLNMEPIRWTPTHSYAVARLMAWEMNVSWWSELTYAHFAEVLPAPVVQELFPSFPDIHPPEVTAHREDFQPATGLLQILDLEFSIRTLSQKGGTTVGSNAWVAAGERTETGLPLLAGDPHMGLSIPGHWFEVHLSLNGKNISGATIPGAPMIVLGQNDHLAWSLTNMMSDDTDFFLEIPNPDNPEEQYVADSLNGEAVYEEFQWQNEVISVQNGDDQLYRIRKTRHGPVISDIYPEQELLQNHLVSMAWTGHRASQELWALYKINWAENIDEFREGLTHFKSPGQNFAYGDRDGNIAIFSAAGLPIRDHNPIYFRNGWDPSYDWLDWIPFEELPHIINPPEGYVANANHQMHPDSYPHYIGTFWESASRINRIDEFFAEHEILTPEIFEQMQNDSYSIHARELIEIILPVLRMSGPEYDFSSITPYLANWDFHYNHSSTAATIMDMFFLELTRNTLLDEMGQTAYENFILLERVPVLVMNRLLREDSFLFNRSETPEIETRDQMIRESMQSAVHQLRESYGEEPFQWRWGNLHTLTLRPPLFGEARQAEDASRTFQLIVDNLLSKGPYPVTGHGMSLNKGQYNWKQPFEMVAGASIRRIVDLSSPARSSSVLPTGQSGNPFSEFYGDQTNLWLNGQYRYLYQDSTFFRESSYQTQTLSPKP